MKRVFIIHGWDSSPKEGWFPWLKRELEARGFQVLAPQMPDSQNPRIYNWVPKLAEVVGKADRDTYFVGHSMGCQAIARYIETLDDGVKIGGAVFVAGFFSRLTGLEDDMGAQETDRHWLQAAIDFIRIRSRLLSSIAIFSTDDPYVPLDNKGDFINKLGSKVIIEEGKGHFSGSEGFTELPLVLEALLELST